MYIVIENQIHWNQIQCHVASNFIRLSFICSPWKVEDTDKTHKQFVAIQGTEHLVAFVIIFAFSKGFIIKRFALELSNNATLSIWWQTKLFESVCACIWMCATMETMGCYWRTIVCSILLSKLKRNKYRIDAKSMTDLSIRRVFTSIFKLSIPERRHTWR